MLLLPGGVPGRSHLNQAWMALETGESKADDDQWKIIGSMVIESLVIESLKAQG